MSVTPGSPPNQIQRVPSRQIPNITRHPIVAEVGTSYLPVTTIPVQQHLRDFRRYRFVFDRVNIVQRAIY